MIYLVEDDESIRELVIYTLKSQGFEAKGFERPSHFWKALEKEEPALLLLDVMLPEEDGISILKKLRMRPDISFHSTGGQGRRCRSAHPDARRSRVVHLPAQRQDT